MTRNQTNTNAIINSIGAQKENDKILNIYGPVYLNVLIVDRCVTCFSVAFIYSDLGPISSIVA